MLKQNGVISLVAFIGLGPLNSPRVRAHALRTLGDVMKGNLDNQNELAAMRMPRDGGVSADEITIGSKPGTTPRGNVEYSTCLDWSVFGYLRLGFTVSALQMLLLSTLRSRDIAERNAAFYVWQVWPLLSLVTTESDSMHY